MSSFLCCNPSAIYAETNGIETSDPVSPLTAPKVLCHGTIMDNEGEPLLGATVSLRGTAFGTITDENGNFELSVPKNAELVVSFVGFDEAIFSADADPVTIRMNVDNVALEDVVVIGYGAQKKINLSGSVEQVNAKDIEKRPITDLSKGLQGMVPNLNIDFVSGEPGKTANINIRGEASINGGNPLLIVDGVETDISEMNRLLPEDIESISVLKDAASAAIYGARAAFGVILIKTKEGKGERITVSYNNNFTWKRPSQLTDKTSDPYIFLKLKNIAVLNTPWSSGHVANDERLEWARQRSDIPQSVGSIRLNPLDQTQWEYMGDTDWTRHYLDRATFTDSHQLSVAGATPKTSFYLSAGYEGEEGLLSELATDRYTRYSTRAKVKYNVFDWLSVVNNTNYVLTDRTKPTHYNLDDIYNAKPVDVDRNEDGSWAATDLGKSLAQIVDGGSETTRNSHLQSTFSAEMNFWERLLTVNANYTYSVAHEDYKWHQTRYQIGYGPADFRQEGTSRAYKGSSVSTRSVFDLYATLHKKLDRHDMTAIVGYNQEKSSTDSFTADRYELISASLPTIALASGNQYVGETYKDWSIRGLYYRLNYIFDDKYIVEVDGRYDGTSRFPSKHRFGFFPSGSLAWRVDSESFFAPLRSVFSQFKLRGSYGALGNQLVSEYGYIPAMSASLGSYLVDGKLQQTVSAPGLVSDNYTWEQVKTLNGGVDMAFFNNRLTASFDLYRRDTEDMLTQGKELPGVLGTSEPNENAANMRTMGWELSVGYKDRFKLAGKPFSYGVRLVLSDNRSKITRFDNPDKKFGQYYEGMEIGEMWGLESDGFFRTKEEIQALDETEIIPWGALTITEGWPRYIDQNGDGRITKGTTVDEPGDLKIIGNSSPRFRYGLNLNAEWNGFDLSAFLQGIGKRDVYPLSYLYWSFYQQPYYGGQVHAFDFYRPTSDTEAELAKHSQSYIEAGLANQNLSAQYPVFQSWLADKNLGTSTSTAMGLAIPQTKYMLNGAYLRIKNITLGYRLPSRVTNLLHISSLRIYASADNVFEFSPLKKYFDPEAVTDNSNFGYVYPFNRQYTFGLNLIF